MRAYVRAEIMSKADLKLDWCSYAAAKYAVEHWHYSHSLPVPPLVRIGVWEVSRYIGCVLFSRGASTNLLRPYGLNVTEGCELTRVALNAHRAPVTRIIAVAIRLLKSANPKLRLIVSYADPMQQHIGAIYQAGNWIYTGTSAPDRAFIDNKGKKYHSRVIAENGSGYRRQFGVLRKCLPAAGMIKVITPGKHRYLMPLDDEIRQRIAHLAKPYPKRVGSADSGTAERHSAGGGANPTSTLEVMN